VIIGGQWLSHYGIVTDDRVVTNLNVVINGRVISDLHIPADSRIPADVNISAVEFHIIEILSVQGHLQMITLTMVVCSGSRARE
jgi:hypothetical protein